MLLLCCLFLCFGIIDSSRLLSHSESNLRLTSCYSKNKHLTQKPFKRGEYSRFFSKTLSFAPPAKPRYYDWKVKESTIAEEEMKESKPSKYSLSKIIFDQQLSNSKSTRVYRGRVEGFEGEVVIKRRMLLFVGSPDGHFSEAKRIEKIIDLIHTTPLPFSSITESVEEGLTHEESLDQSTSIFPKTLSLQYKMVSTGIEVWQIMEYVPGLSLFQFTNSLSYESDGDQSGFRKFIAALTSLFNVISQIHSHGYAHGRLKEKNIIVSMDEEGKIMVKLLNFQAIPSNTPAEIDNQLLLKTLEHLKQRLPNKMQKVVDAFIAYYLP